MDKKIFTILCTKFMLISRNIDSVKFHKHTEYVEVQTNIIHGPLATMFY